MADSARHRGTRRHRLDRRLGAGRDRAPPGPPARQRAGGRQPGRCPARAVRGASARACGDRRRSRCYAALREGLRDAGLATQAHAGAAALDALAASDACDTVVAAIVGAAGLGSTLAAARAGKRLLLANKESLVLAGELLMAAASGANAEIIPIDSEHNAIFQCLRSRDDSGRCAAHRADRFGRPVPRPQPRIAGLGHPGSRRSPTRNGRWGRRSRWIRPR